MVLRRLCSIDQRARPFPRLTHNARSRRHPIGAIGSSLRALDFALCARVACGAVPWSPLRALSAIVVSPDVGAVQRLHVFPHHIASRKARRTMRALKRLAVRAVVAAYVPDQVLRPTVATIAL